jgi:hypothetical protein
MSEKAYLLNTSILTADRNRLEAEHKKNRKTMDFIGEGVYKIPVPWILCFKPADFQTITYRYDWIYEGEKSPPPDKVRLPATTVKAASANLRAARPVFEKICRHPRIAELFWQSALDSLDSMAKLPYLTIDPFELWDDKPAEFCHALEVAASGGPNAIKEMISLSSYSLLSGIYPPEFLGSFPVEFVYSSLIGNMDKSRLDNSVALDFNAGSSMAEIDYSKLPKRGSGDPPSYVVPPNPNYQITIEEVGKLLGGRPKISEIEMSFLPRKEKKQTQLEIAQIVEMARKGVPLYNPATEPKESLKLRVSSPAQRELDRVRADPNLRAQLSGKFRRQFEAISQQYGYNWLGYVFISDEAVKKNKDWAGLPVEKDL